MVQLQRSHTAWWNDVKLCDSAVNRNMKNKIFYNGLEKLQLFYTKNAFILAINIAWNNENIGAKKLHQLKVSQERSIRLAWLNECTREAEKLKQTGSNEKVWFDLCGGSNEGFKANVTGQNGVYSLWKQSNFIQKWIVYFLLKTASFVSFSFILSNWFLHFFLLAYGLPIE